MLTCYHRRQLAHHIQTLHTPLFSFVNSPEHQQNARVLRGSDYMLTRYQSVVCASAEPKLYSLGKALRDMTEQPA